MNSPPQAPKQDLEWSESKMESITRACTEFAINHIATLPQQPSWDLEGAHEVAASFREPIPEHGTDIKLLLERLDGAAQKTFNTAGPGYLAFIPGGGIYAATLGDYLALAINRYVGVWNPAPALVQMELAAIDWIREMVGFPAGGNGLLTSGGSLSNFIAIATARRIRLPENFLSGIIYTTQEAHHCIAKAALLAGFPEKNLRLVDVDERLRLQPKALERAIETDRKNGLTPFLVVSSAGTTNTGAIDPTDAIADICDRHELWLHVDAAYGGFFRMLKNGAELLPGLERADSLVLDPHKGLFLPYGTGCLLMKNADDLRQAHHLGADYLQDLDLPDGAVNFSDISPELSRDFRGLRLWLPLKLMGASIFRDQLQEKFDLAQWAYQEILALPGFECFDAPQLSVVPFRYMPQKGNVNEFNRQLLRRINAKRHVFMTSTMIRDQFVLRIAVLSFRTHANQIQQALEDIRQSVKELESEASKSS